LAALAAYSIGDIKTGLRIPGSAAIAFRRSRSTANLAGSMPCSVRALNRARGSPRADQFKRELDRLYLAARADGEI
jgi:hypothetical protein